MRRQSSNNNTMTSLDVIVILCIWTLKGYIASNLAPHWNAHCLPRNITANRALLFIWKTALSDIPLEQLVLLSHHKTPQTVVQYQIKISDLHSEENIQAQDRAAICVEAFTDDALFISSVQGFCLKWFLTTST